LALRVEAVGLSLSSEAVGGRVGPGSKRPGRVAYVSSFLYGQVVVVRRCSVFVEARSLARSLPVERLGIVSRVCGRQKAVRSS